MLRFMRRFLALISVYFFFYSLSFAQESSVPYSKVYSDALNGDIPSALKLLDKTDYALSDEDREFKTEFLLRFNGEEDESSYLVDENVPFFELQSMFRNYWRMSLLNPGENYMGHLGREIVPFLMQNYPPIREVNIDRDSIGVYLSRYIHSQGFYTQEEVDISGHLLDLMIWKSQADTVITLDLDNEELNVPVVRMKEFVTLGWREYATLGTHYPGGWATKKALYMVDKAYDVNSEEFRVSFIAHEGRHHLDLIDFHDLENDHLEYRAKLTELAVADATAYELIGFFIDNSDKYSDVPHFVANYNLIQNLSEMLFNVDFEKDINRWREVDISKINESSNQLLIDDTESLKKNDTQ